MPRLTFALTLAATTAAIAAIAATVANPATALSVKRCGAVPGPTVHIGTTTLSHYSIVGVKIDCGFAKTTVAAIVKQHLPDSLTPTRTKGPSGWTCIAQEVDNHIAVAGHCQEGRSTAFSWVGAGLHP
jgi:hypothetical protein